MGERSGVDSSTMDGCGQGDVLRLPVSEWFRIRWHHRRVGHPDLWTLRVRFDEIVLANRWNLAANFDELVERYAELY